MFVVVVLHSIHLTHTDLKPENILFVDSSYEVVGSQKKMGKKVDHPSDHRSLSNNPTPPRPPVYAASSGGARHRVDGAHTSLSTEITTRISSAFLLLDANMMKK